jgi:hypothetical protein
MSGDRRLDKERNMKTVPFIVSIMIILLACLFFNTVAQSQRDAKKPSVPGPSPFRLVATDVEVRQFFNHYIERYTRKDREGFLSLFSSKAIQNQRAGLEEIRDSYSNFFNESLELQFGIEDQKVEIYENAMEVKARYKIEQLVGTSGERKVFRGRIRWVLTKEGGELKILSIDYQQEKSA